MKKILLSIILGAGIILITPGGAEAQNNKKKKNKSNGKEQVVELKSFIDTISYIIGRDLGNNLSIIHEELNLDIVTKALNDSFNGKEGVFTQLESDSLIEIFQNRLIATENANTEKMANENRIAGEQFLEQNSQREEVSVLADGLQIEVIEEGEGPTPKSTDKVNVHYRGTLIDGTEFDSSYERGESISFRLDGVIKGWTIGLQEMKTGGKYKLYIPPDLGYGNRDVGPIPAGSTLIFEIELLGID